MGKDTWLAKSTVYALLAQKYSIQTESEMYLLPRIQKCCSSNYTRHYQINFK